jgi:hypothetical protein
MHQGSCHCGAVRMTLPSTPKVTAACNCSLCRQIGGPVGLLRIRFGQDRGTFGGHGRVHLGRQNTSHHLLQNLRLRHALGAAGPQARLEAWRQSRQFRSETHCLSARASPRWRGYLAISQRVKALASVLAWGGELQLLRSQTVRAGQLSVGRPLLAEGRRPGNQFAAPWIGKGGFGCAELPS